MYVKIALSIWTIIVPTIAHPINAFLSEHNTKNSTNASQVTLRLHLDGASWQSLPFGILSITLALGSFIVGTLHYRKERQSQIGSPRTSQDLEMTSVAPRVASLVPTSNDSCHSQRVATMDSVRTVVVEPPHTTIQSDSMS